MFKNIDIRDYNKLMNYPNKILDEYNHQLAEEIFYNYIDNNFSYGMLETPGLDDILQFENFFPYLVNKDIGEGSWVKVKTDVGYNVYYAKKSNKVLNTQQIERKFKKIRNKKLSNSKDLKDIDNDLNILNEKTKATNEMIIASVVNEMPSDLKYIKALRTKSQWMYLLPYEYEIISDIQLYVNAILDKQNKNAVRYKQLFTKQDHDQVFYMQSRGIPKDLAIMMCRLQQCYFIIDVNALFSEVYQTI